MEQLAVSHPSRERQSLSKRKSSILTHVSGTMAVECSDVKHQNTMLDDVEQSAACFSAFICSLARCVASQDLEHQTMFPRKGFKVQSYLIPKYELICWHYNMIMSDSEIQCTGGWVPAARLNPVALIHIDSLKTVVVLGLKLLCPKKKA